MQILQLPIKVPTGNTYKVGAQLRSNGKVGRISFNFINQPNSGLDNKSKAAEPILVNIYESSDGTTWNSPINPSPITVAGGGEMTATVNTSKTFIRISVKGVNGKGGSLRMHASYEGRQDMGQLDIMERGKAGYGFDGGTELGQGPGSIPDYPEGAPT